MIFRQGTRLWYDTVDPLNVVYITDYETEYFAEKHCHEC